MGLFMVDPLTTGDFQISFEQNKLKYLMLNQQA
jgi:hypothetical protein